MPWAKRNNARPYLFGTQVGFSSENPPFLSSKIRQQTVEPSIFDSENFQKGKGSLPLKDESEPIRFTC